MSYQRWYDTDPNLSMVVRAMEMLNFNSQLRFAKKLLDMSEEWLKEQGGETYLENLDSQRREGLNKAQVNKNRWYDRYETLHKAFNNLYALDHDARCRIAAQLALPIEIVEAYERYCDRRGLAPDLLVIEEILRSSFNEGEKRTRKLYAIYLTDIQCELENHMRRQQALQNSKPPQSPWSMLLENLQGALSPA